MRLSGLPVAGDGRFRLRQGQQLFALRLQVQVDAQEFRCDPSSVVGCDEIAPGHSPALPGALQASLVVDHTVVVGLIVFGLAVEADGHVALS